MKQFLLSAAALIFCGLTANAAVNVSDTVYVDDIRYQVTACSDPEFRVIVIDNTDYSKGTLVIPDSVTYLDQKYAVAYINSFAFDGNKNIESADINTDIYRGAFRMCYNLKSITFGDNVTEIATIAFSRDTSLVTVHIPATVESLSNFSNNQSFTNCTHLSTFTVDEANPNYCAADGVLYNKDTTKIIAWPLAKKDFTGFSDKITSIAPAAFSYYQYFDTLRIPATLQTYKDAFHGTSVKVLYVDGTSVASNAFQNSGSLQTLYLGKEIAIINQLNFREAASLKDIYCYNPEMPNWGYGSNTNWPSFSNCFSATVHVHCGQSATYAAEENKWANFTNIVEELLYDVNVVAENGVATISDTTSCNNVTITATPNADCEFIQWSDGSTDNPRTIEITSDTTLTAEIRAMGTSVDNIEASAFDIYTQERTIIIENAEGTAEIYSIEGRLVGRTNREITVAQAGVYFIKVGNNVQKVVIK